MIKNLKHSLLFILIVITLLLVVVTSLAASKPVGQMEKNGISIPLDPIINGKWTGLGMGMFTAWNNSVMDGYLGTLLDNGFTYLRMDIPDYQDTEWVAASKTGVLNAINRGAKVIWGVSSNKYNNPAYTITAANWPNFRAAILNAAQWAQDNGVYEFQVGNEEEYHIDETTMTEIQIINNLKSVATEVQAIFTNGNVSYSCGRYPIPNWVSVGRGSIDLLALNVYRETPTSTVWQDGIDDMVNNFGVDHTYITEFNLNSVSLDNYSTDEAVQSAAIGEMVEYVKASGITRAHFFCWKAGGMGVLGDGDTFRLLWNQIL